MNYITVNVSDYELDRVIVDKKNLSKYLVILALELIDIEGCGDWQWWKE
jgi:hypothetical protein